MKIAFLDRDGVINKEKNYMFKIEDFEYVSDAVKGMKALLSLGFKIIIVTNQAGIAKGYYSIQDMEKLHVWMLNDLKQKNVNILDIFYCPHHVDGIIEKYKKKCDCRKPSTGMLDAALIKYDVDIPNSIIIGDKITDIEAGKNFGIEKRFLVSTGHYIKRNIKTYDSILSVAKELR